MNLDEKLSALLSGDLPPEEAEVLRDRIAHDEEVAARWDALQHLAADLDDLDLPDVDEARIAEVLDRAEQLPAAAARHTDRPRWRRWLPVLAAAAAGLVLGIGLPRRPAEPVSIQLDGDGMIVEGRAQLTTPEGAIIDLDGKAHVRTRAEDPGVKVLEGSAHVTGTSDPVDLGAAERWAPDIAPSGPPPPAPAAPSGDAELERARATIDRLEVELALARGRLATHEGEPPAWPADLPEVLRPGAFEAEVRRAVAAAPEVQLLAVDCSEFPCAVLAYQALGPGDSRDWPALLYPIADQVPQRWEVVDLVREEERGDMRHTVAVMTLLTEPDAEALQTRLLFRARELIDIYQPDVMR